MASVEPTTVLAVVIGSAALLRMSYFWLLPKPIPDIPHNPISSIWGDMPTLVKASKGWKRPFMDSVCDVIDLRDGIAQILLGRKALVIISDVKETERLLNASKGTDLTKRVNQAFATVIPDSQISLPADETWRRHRRLAGPSMSRRYLERMSVRINNGANNLVYLWKVKMDIIGTLPFDASLDVQLASMDNMVDLTIGRPLGCIESLLATIMSNNIQPAEAQHFPRQDPPPIYRAITRMMETIEAASKSPFPLLYGRFLRFTSASWRKEYRTLSSFISSKISHARERESIAEKESDGLFTDADCMLDMFIQREARGAEALGDGAIHDELITYIFGGQDTTGSLLRWLVKYLPRDAEIQRRLHDEVCGIFGEANDVNGSLDFNLLDDPERLPLLEAVVAETLRCAGVGGQILRELTQDQIILGRSVPKGTELVFPIALMSRDKEHWGRDADEWRPTRWLTPAGVFNRLAGPSFPFGLGQRSCFGKRLAVLQLKAYTAALSRQFFFKPLPQELDSWQAFETVSKQPRQCYVYLQRWEKL